MSRGIARVCISLPAKPGFYTCSDWTYVDSHPSKSSLIVCSMKRGLLWISLP